MRTRRLDERPDGDLKDESLVVASMTKVVIMIIPERMKEVEKRRYYVAKKADGDSVACQVWTD